MKENIYRNPFIMGLWAPAYLLIGTTTILNDFLLAAMFIMATLSVIGAYVTEFPIFNSLYMNEMAHKTSISSLMGMVLGLMLFFIFIAGSGEDTTSGMISAQGQFMLTWAVMSAPAYPLMVFLVSRVNKRNLEEEDRIRQEKKKKRKSSGGGGPPIMDRDSF